MQNQLLKPIFIGGTGRSGTTILKALLQQHSEIVAVPKELRIIVDPDGMLDLFSALTERWSVNRADIAIHRFDRLISQCTKISPSIHILRQLRKYKFPSLSTGGYHNLLSGFGNDHVRSQTDLLMSELISHRSKAEMMHTPPYLFRPDAYESGPFDKEDLIGLLRCYIDDLYSNLAIKSKATYWLDDTPSNILHAVELAELFKDMKLIHIYRDPRDVVSSYMTKRWGGDDWEQISRRVAGIYKQWHMIRAGLSNQQFIEISLEELSKNPRPTLQKVCDHIGIGFEEKLLDIKLNRTNSGRWEKEIPSKSMDAIHGHLNPYLSDYISTK